MVCVSLFKNEKKLKKKHSKLLKKNINLKKDKNNLENENIELKKKIKKPDFEHKTTNLNIYLCSNLNCFKFFIKKKPFRKISVEN